MTITTLIILCFGLLPLPSECALLLHKLAGHGNTPNLSPSVQPAKESEEDLKLLDVLFDGESSLPNTWDSKPLYRYPYYDRNGDGYLLYGYGDKELYEYSEFNYLEGYF